MAGQGGDERREGVPTWLAVLGAIVAILVGGYTLSPVVTGWFDHHDPVEVELGEVGVSNPHRAFAGVSQTPESEPTVTATVRNEGEDTAFIDEARVTIFDGTRLHECFTQGGGPDVPHSKPYRLTMPEYPGTKPQVVHRQMHVEVRPGSGARPLLRFQKLLDSATDLYAIDVKFIVDPGQKELDLGRFVIGVPGAPDRGGTTLPEDESALTNELFEDGVSSDPAVPWCLHHNLEGVRRLAADPGRRSSEIAALSQLRVAPAWAKFANLESPREAVKTLLDPEAPDVEGEVYAVEAAAETGDSAFEAQVRRRAVALLVERGEEDLGKAAESAAGEAERALALEPDEAAKRLLTEAKAAAIVQAADRQAELEADETGLASDGGG